MVPTKIQILEKVDYDLDKAKAIWDWACTEDAGQSANPNKNCPFVSIHEQDGMKGVRLCVADVDIFIEAQDLDNGKEFEWQKAMDSLKKLGKSTFSKHEGYFIAAFIDEINEKLREIGGKELDKTYWSSTKYGSNNAWYVNFSSGYVDINLYKSNSFVVRPVAASKILGH
jgi:hypothetical protein